MSSSNEKAKVGNYEDINAFSFSGVPAVEKGDEKKNEKVPVQEKNDSEDNQLRISRIPSGEKEIDITLQNKYKDKIEVFSEEESYLNDTNILAIVNQLKNVDDVKQSFSIFEDDYLEARKLPEINDDDFQKVVFQVSQNDFMKVKKIVDDLPFQGKIVGNSLVIQKLMDHIQDSSKLKEISGYLSQFERTIYRWRPLLKDNNSFYRCTIFFYLEYIVVNRKVKLFKELIADINASVKDPYLKEKFNKYQIKKDMMMILLFLMHFALSLPDPKESVSKAYEILIKSYNSNQSFDFGLILYLKYSIMKYLKENESQLYSREISVHLKSLLPLQYQREDEKENFEGFYETELMPLNKKAEKMTIYVTPFVIGLPLSVYVFDFQSREKFLSEFTFDCFKKGLSKNDWITFLFTNGSFEVLYSKDYFTQHSFLLQDFNANIKKDPHQIKTSSKNPIQFSTIQQNQRQMTQQCASKTKNALENTQTRNPPEPELRHQKSQKDFFKGGLSSIDNSSSPRGSLKELTATNFSDHSPSTPFKNGEKKNVSQVVFRNSKTFCALCKKETFSTELCDSCVITKLKQCAWSIYPSYINKSTADLRSGKEQMNYISFFGEILVSVGNGKKVKFIDLYNSLQPKNKFDIYKLREAFKSSLCIKCLKFLRVSESLFFFQLPCGCVFCCVDCVMKYFKSIDYSRIKKYRCVCGDVYDFFQLKYLFYFLWSHHLNGPKSEILRFLCEIFKSKCARCQKIISESVENLNVLELKDKEIDKIFQIEKFNHLLCDICYKETEKENFRLNCSICNSIHAIIRKVQIKNANNRKNCNIF